MDKIGGPRQCHDKKGAGCFSTFKIWAPSTGNFSLMGGLLNGGLGDGRIGLYETAAAYGEAGKFDDAVRTERQALKKARGARL